MARIMNRRWGPCPHCGASGWDAIGSGRSSRLFDHDRPQGGHCHLASKLRYAVVLHDSLDPWNRSRQTIHGKMFRTPAEAESAMNALPSHLTSRAAVLDLKTLSPRERTALISRRPSAEKHERGENPRVRTQEEHFTSAHARAARGDQTMLDLLYGPNPISDDELRKLIAKRPHVYGKYAAYLGKRGEKHESGQNPRVSAPLKRRIDRVLGRGRRV